MNTTKHHDSEQNDTEHHDEYGDLFVAGLEWIWGEGFMSPGGPAEVREILRGVDVTGKNVLDIGCGIGGIDLLLVKEHGAAHVTGIDVEAPLIKRAQESMMRAGVADQISCQLVSAGPLPFDDNSFDIVFSKDSMIHIPDKAAIYNEILRVLKPGGKIAFSDWFGSQQPGTPEFVEWLKVVGLTFKLGTIEEAATLLTDIGFAAVTINDRNQWYAQTIQDELATLEGENFERLAAEHGADFAAQRLRSSSLKQVVVEQGHLRPGHVQAHKPIS